MKSWFKTDEEAAEDARAAEKAAEVAEEERKEERWRREDEYRAQREAAYPNEQDPRRHDRSFRTDVNAVRFMAAILDTLYEIRDELRKDK